MKVAVVGATGMVGGVMLKVLREMSFPVTELIPVASENSIGKKIDFGGLDCEVVGLQTAVDLVPDIAVFSAGADKAGDNFSRNQQGQTCQKIIRGRLGQSVRQLGISGCDEQGERH